MKVYFHIPILLLSILLCCGAPNLGNCFASDLQQTPSDEQDEVIRENKLRGQVIFYSRTGNTRTVAEVIAKSLDFHLQEIQDLKDRSGFFGFIGGMIDVRKNPITTISPEAVDLDEYDVLFIGSPIWGMKFAPAITTFLEGTDFTGKKVILFTTTSSRMKQTAFDQYSDLIHTKGGTVIDTFFLKTFWKEANEIREEAQEMFAAKKELWLKKTQIDEQE
jgi:flavodoxin